MQHKDIDISRLRAEDSEDFLSLSREFYSSDAVLHPVPDEYHISALNELLRSDNYIVCYIFRCLGTTAGYALIVKSYSREAGGTAIWIDELYVRSEFRGRGIASRFFGLLFEEYPAARYRLETEPDNFRAESLYRRVGFTDLPYKQMRLDT